tara:strand:- start:156 stop:395 length:240 start_codon:yes stop_codon:yes gene_type:complete
MKKIHELNGCKYRVVNNLLESKHPDLDDDFYPVEYFSDFTVGNLLELTDVLGKFIIGNSMLGTYNFRMTIELNGINGQK